MNYDMGMKVVDGDLGYRMGSAELFVNQHLNIFARTEKSEGVNYSNKVNYYSLNK